MAQQQQPIVNQQIDYNAVLQALISNDENIRKPAEELYNSLPETDVFVMLGAIVCNHDAVEDIRVNAAILLRRLIIVSWEDIKNAIPAQQLIATCNQFLFLLKSSASLPKSVRDKICNIVGPLGKCYLDEKTGMNHWSEFIQTLFEMFMAPEPELRISAFSIFADTPSVLGTYNDQTAYIDQLYTCLVQNLDETNKTNEFYVALTGAVCALLSANCSNKECLKKLSTFSIPVTNILRQINDNNDKETICQQLIVVAEEAPISLRPCLNDLLQYCLNLSTIEDDTSDVRAAAFELAVSLIENAPSMVKKRAGNLIRPLVLRALDFMTKIDDDPEWYTSSLGEKDEEDLDCLGETALDRIATSLGGKIILPILSEEVTLMLQKQEWQARHAGLMAFSCAGEGCREQISKILDQVVSGILNYLKDPHPRVRYAACNAIGQMSTDFSPEMEEKFHALALPALLDLVVDFSQIRVQSHAAAAIVNFVEECPKEVLQGYVDPICERLRLVLSRYLAEGIPKEEHFRAVVEQLVVTLSAVADTAQEKFILQKDLFIPVLKYIIQTATDQEDLRLMRGKAIECVSLIGVAIGKEMFMADASDIMQMLLKTQTGEAQLADDDPQLSYIMAACARICKILGAEFQAYLPYVMPSVLNAASVKVQIALLSEQDREAIENGNEQWECLEVQDQAVGIKTAGLDDKATACSMLVCYARDLKQAFVDWVDKSAEVLVPLLKFPLHDDIRYSAAEILPYLLESTKAKGDQAVLALWESVYPNLYSAIQCEEDAGVLDSMLDSLGDCITTVGVSSLNAERLQQITELLKEKLGEHFELLKRLYEECKDEDYEADSDCDDDEEDFLSGIAKVLDCLLLVLKNEYFPFFDQLVENIVKLSSDDAWVRWSDKQNALCIWNSVIEHTKQASVKYKDIFLPILSRGALDKNEEIKEAAEYGISLLQGENRDGMDYN